MPLREFETLEFGGVDSRSNPLNMPQKRFLRCLNWVPKEAGYLELRYGYSTVSMSTVNNTAFGTLIPYTLWNGDPYVLGQQGTQWIALNSLGTVTQTPIHDTNFAFDGPSQFYNFNNRIHVGNGVDQKFWDGTSWRNSGLRELNSTESSNVTVSQGTNDTTGLPASSVAGAQPGYEFYASIYNPTTGHIGNRVLVGVRLNNTVACDIDFVGLPNLSALDSEWVCLIGRTRDGAEVPYICTDPAGNWLYATNSTFTLTSGVIDGNYEMPTRNGIIPPQCTMFAVVGDYIWAADPYSPYLRRSGSQIDSLQGIFPGLPEQSWAPNDIFTFPTAQPVRGVYEIDLELFVGTRNDCAIVTDMAGIPQWRGPWNVGIAGPRAGVKTHSGFYWMSFEKELCTFVNGLPVVISGEYEAAELAQLGTSHIGLTELVYYRDRSKLVDVIRIEGYKEDGSRHTVIHDFNLRDDRSPYGQAYGSEFTGPLGTQYTSAVVRDGQQRLSLYCGSLHGQIYRLYDGANDGGSEYDADAIGLINPGPDRVSVAFMDWYGDNNLQISYSRKLNADPNSTSSTEFVTITQEVGGSPETVQGYEDSYLYRAKLPKPEILQFFLRLQLSSHSTDGNLDFSSPPHCPLEPYGRLYELIPAAGNERGR